MQKIKEGDTGQQVADLLYENSLLASNITFDLKHKSASAQRFLDVVKNIYITSTLKINADNVRLSYVGLHNTNYQLIIVQLTYTDGGKDIPVNFYVPTGGVNFPLEGLTVKCMGKEGATEFGQKTDVYLELYDNFEISPDKLIIGLDKGESVLNPLAFPQGLAKSALFRLNTYTLVEAYKRTTPLLNTIKNIYVKSKFTDLEGNVKLQYFSMNFENRRLLLQLQYKNETPVSYFIPIAVNGDTLSNRVVLMPNKELISEFAEITDLFIEFQKFDKFPADSFNQGNDGNHLKLTPTAFEVPRLITAFETPKKNNEKRHTVIPVSVEAGGNNAIQKAIDAINDASADNTYELDIAQGVYEAVNSSDFKGYRADYPAFICPKDFVSLKGRDKSNTIVKASLPFNDSEIDTAVARDKHQTIYNFAGDLKISNITFEAYNLRYTLHQDAGQEAFKKREYIDCDFYFWGRKGNVKAHGIGTFSGSETYFIGGKSICGLSSPLAIHNNQAFTKKSVWSFTNHVFANLKGADIFEIQNSGSLMGDDFILNNCNLSGAIGLNYIDWWIYTHAKNSHFNHAEWRITGANNSPMFFNNTVNGKSLAVRSSTKGDASKVRFKGGSAKAILIDNPHKNKFGVLGHPERRVVNGEYIVFDGGGDLEGYAIGCVGVREEAYLWGTKESAEPIGKRLGDCSANNKTLIVEIDGSEKTITFNKNYTSLTNASIIGDINTALAGAGEAYIANVGADYYAEFTDVLMEARNLSSTETLKKGTLVSFKGNGVAPATSESEVFGLLIDDIQPYKVGATGDIRGVGRVIRNCYITTTKGGVSTVIATSEGDKYKVVNGVLTPDPNGALQALKNKEGYPLIKI